MSKILLIEDNEQLQKFICEYLSAYGYTPHILSDYDRVLETIATVSPKLILLDITLPKFDGFYFLKLIRKRYKMPIIIISARSDEAEQIRGIEDGADDYITKPFSIGVLMVKINAIFKKAESNDETLCVGSLSLSPRTMEITYNGTTSELTKNEYKILSLLMGSAGHIVTREQMLEELWDDTNFIDDNTLAVNISRVRKKLQDIGLNDAIATKRGVGYVLDKACI